MEAVKRVEIVLAEVHLGQLLSRLGGLGLAGYTAMRGVTGRGDRGVQAGDGLSGEFSNAYVLIACPAAQLDALLGAVRPMLADWGGVCLVSDALWLKH